MKKLIGVFLLLILAAVGATLTKDGSATMISLQKLFHTPTAVIKNQTFSLEIAKTEAEREKGLSGRDSLPLNSGMLFIFDKPDYYGFWMKDMKFPIDIIFIHDKQVITVYQKVLPPAKNATSLQIVKPSEPADMVLEMNAGLANQYHIQTGDSVSLSL
jgi:uncharacterized membrane protein (UPF0127 family)